MSSSISYSYSQSGYGYDGSNGSAAGGDYERGVDWASAGPTTAAYAAIYAAGLLGNALVLFAVRRCRRLHTATGLLLANLAAADLLLVGLLVPVKVSVELLDHWPLGEAGCRLLAHANIACPTCSLLTMTAIAMERCYVVLFPLETKSAITVGRTRLLIPALWVASIALSSPALFAKTTLLVRGGGETWVICGDAWPSEGAAIAYALYVTAVLFALPLLVLTVCYALVIRQLCAARLVARRLTLSPASAAATAATPGSSCGRRPGGEGAANARSDDAGADGEVGEGATKSPRACRASANGALRRPRKQRKTDAGNLQRIVAMLVVVVVVFVLCWGPFFTYALLLRLGVLGANYTDGVWRASQVLHFLAYANSCANPFIYAFMSANFREGFAAACRCRCCLGGPAAAASGRRGRWAPQGRGRGRKSRLGSSSTGIDPYGYTTVTAASSTAPGTGSVRAAQTSRV